MSAKHTPGPWSASMWTDEIAGSVGWSISAGNPSYRVPTNTFEGDEEEAKANARLIAAAPELLEFAIAAMDYLQHPDGHHLPPGTWFKLNEQVRAAIAKATGERQ